MDNLDCVLPVRPHLQEHMGSRVRRRSDFQQHTKYAWEPVRTDVDGIASPRPTPVHTNEVPAHAIVG
jgi:hypothetical protein